MVGEAYKLEEVTKLTPEEDSVVISERTYREVMSHVHVYDLGEKAVRDGTTLRAFAVQGIRTETRETVKA